MTEAEIIHKQIPYIKDDLKEAKRRIYDLSITCTLPQYFQKVQVLIEQAQTQLERGEGKKR